MAKGGKRYPLVLYTVMMDHWRPIIFVIGLAMFGVAYDLFRTGAEQWRGMVTGGVGALSVFVALAMTLMRKSAYIKPFSYHFKLATPFLRLNISYKRVRRTSSVDLRRLFPRYSITSRQSEIISPISKMTAIVIELASLPMSQAQLKLFLSPLFFKDKTPHFVIVIENWMQLSSEMESMRTGVTTSAPQKKRDSSILSRLPRK